MITPEDERPKAAREDGVTIELSDLDREVCALLRIARTAGGAETSALALACLGGETALVDDPAAIRLETEEPLVRWTCRVESESVALEAELEAVSLPVQFGEPLTSAAGMQWYEQLCRVRGEIRLDGRRTEIDGVGRRAHAWGEPASARLRTLYAVAGDRAVTVTAVRPRDADEHGAELISAYMLRPESAPEPFESARLSTTYDSAGRPRTAGLELFLPGDEYPRRVSGEAVWPAAGDPGSLETAWFRWSLDGDPAQGGYQVVFAA